MNAELGLKERLKLYWGNKLLQKLIRDVGGRDGAGGGAGVAEPPEVYNCTEWQLKYLNT